MYLSIGSQGFYQLNITGIESYPEYAGDINGDGALGLDYLISVLKIMAGDSSVDLMQNADCNFDGKVSMVEAIYILRELSGS